MSIKTSLRTILLSAMVSMAIASMAVASHYRLPVENLINDDETSVFMKAGVATTAALYDQIAKTEKRKAFAAKTGLTFVRLSTLASQTDLLRVDGVGPSMVRLLQAAGVRHTRDLAGSDAAGLREKLRVANDVHGISPVIPQEDVVRAWIGAARGLPQVLEGIN